MLGIGIALPLQQFGGGVAPSAPLLVIRSPSTDNTPEFTIDAAWADQDDLQFERQVAGGDWSAATVTHHTVTSGEITGTIIDLALSALANGNYEARCKFRHSVGPYSRYSNVVSFTILIVSSNHRISSAGNARISSAGNNRIFS